ncbi:MAG: CBS domain-containing protein [Proteobacteria bacterium]|nr:CBS domain-containing protein [Pseudomonadota bacterium]MBU1140304.1 CBS domain-containing protein [Pseudomonadota bacterium]MBU1232971.1 CBS domain-containing protein [Pseudomonadota bacterium]MBU1418291.1 CBS domain-containing protein [Pseudomonadota bacterium]MBU1455409.1 CBS domain-containing protein [Pseudomonadota bacterium]
MGFSDEIIKAVNWNAPSVDMETNFRTVTKMMVDNQSSALIVMKGEEVMGVVTDMDILESFGRNDDLNKTKVAEFMTTCELLSNKEIKSPCAQLDSAASARNALKVMNSAGVHHLLVSDVDKKKVGIVSILDLLKLAIS